MLPVEVNHNSAVARLYRAPAPAPALERNSARYAAKVASSKPLPTRPLRGQRGHPPPHRRGQDLDPRPLRRLPGGPPPPEGSSGAGQTRRPPPAAALVSAATLERPTPTARRLDARLDGSGRSRMRPSPATSPSSTTKGRRFEQRLDGRRRGLLPGPRLAREPSVGRRLQEDIDELRAPVVDEVAGARRS